jgi:hypothetical protein
VVEALPHTKNRGYHISHRQQRNKGEILFAHPKRIMKLDRLRRRGAFGARAELKFQLSGCSSNISRQLTNLCA